MTTKNESEVSREYVAFLNSLKRLKTQLIREARIEAMTRVINELKQDMHRVLTECDDSSRGSSR